MKQNNFFDFFQQIVKLLVDFFGVFSLREFESIEDAITCAREFAQIKNDVILKRQDQSPEDKKKGRVSFLYTDSEREILIFVSRKEDSFVAWLASKASKMCVPIEEVSTSSSSYQLWHYK